MLTLSDSCCAKPSKQLPRGFVWLLGFEFRGERQVEIYYYGTSSATPDFNFPKGGKSETCARTFLLDFREEIFRLRYDPDIPAFIRISLPALI